MALLGNDEACFAMLLAMLHGRRSAWLSLAALYLAPDSEAPCPRCRVGEASVRDIGRRQGIVRDYFCRRCRHVFNAWTGTVFQGTHRTPSVVFLTVYGILLGVPTAFLARELGCNRSWLVNTRRRVENANWFLELREHMNTGRFSVASISLQDIEREVDKKVRNSWRRLGNAPFLTH
jgi:transposase-like protein